MRLGLIGYGAIGQALAARLANCSHVEDLRILIRPNAPQPPLPKPGRYIFTLQQLLGIDMLIEAAGHNAAKSFAPIALGQGVDCLISSVSALADPTFEASLKETAHTGAQLLVPSGAIGGVDMAASLARDVLTDVQYEGRKPPHAWAGTPAEEMLDLANLAEPTVVFEGSARQAALAYPKNANVVATLALATIGFDKTQVRLMADPALTGNQHSYTAEGPVAKMAFSVTAKPEPGNAKSSGTVVLSLMRAIENRHAAIVI